MKSFLLVILAVLLNVLAQIFMKFSGSVNANATVLSIIFSLKTFLAVAAYGASFILTLFIYKNNELSIIGPVMASLTCLFVFGSAFLFFNESISFDKMIGIFCIIVGIYYITI